MQHLLQIENLSKSYLSGDRTLHVIQHYNLSVQRGEMLAIVGRSGSGKTTLLNLIAGLDKAESGHIYFEGKDLRDQSDHEWIRFRQRHIGFVFQFNQLLHEFTALENVMLPGMIKGWDDQNALRERARELLDRMGMQTRIDHLPSQLSGGEQQRTAIARALINSPSLVLADEPTGSLDQTSGTMVFKLLQELQKELQISCLVVTHNRDLATLCDRIRKLDHHQTIDS